MLIQRRLKTSQRRIDLRTYQSFEIFPKVFPEDLPGLPSTRQVEFQINLVPGAASVARAPYRLAPFEMEKLSEQLHEISDKGFIRPSSSPLGALILFVKKNNGSSQMCIDYQKLNKLTVLPGTIEGFSKIAKSMTKLTQKKVKFVWGDIQEAAFQLLKQKLCSAPILALPEGNKDFIIYCDASIKGLGTVLMQQEKVIAYAPRQLKIYEMFTDHKNLKHIHNQKELKARKERIKPLRVRALVMTIGLDLPKYILNAQTKAQKPENIKNEDVGGFAWKGVVHFGKRGKLNPIYVRPFKVLEHVGSVAYKLELPQELSKVHNTFHVSNLKKCHTNEPLAVMLDGLHIDDKLHLVEEPVVIMDHDIKQLKQIRIPIVKGQWNSRRGPEFTWERVD
nr:hypothetical protein [Tanacetum cinerariifolium]